MAHCWWLFQEADKWFGERKKLGGIKQLCLTIYMYLCICLRIYYVSLSDTPYLGFPLYFTHEEYIFMAWPYSVTLRAPHTGSSAGVAAQKNSSPRASGIVSFLPLPALLASGLEGKHRNGTELLSDSSAALQELSLTFAALRACREPFRLLNTNDYGLRTTCLTCSMFVQVPSFSDAALVIQNKQMWWLWWRWRWLADHYVMKTVIGWAWFTSAVGREPFPHTCIWNPFRQVEA